MKRIWFVIPIGLLILAGCGGGAAKSSSAVANAGVASEQARKAPAAGTAYSAASGGGSAKSSVTPLQTRDIVRTATLDVTVGNVDQAADAAVAATIVDGGRADADDRSTDGPNRHANLVLRVPAGRLESLLDKVAGYGHENSRTDHGEDVTADRADVGARVAALRISVARLQDFLSKSGSISELVSLENQLTDRQSQLQSTVAQQNALSDQISLATLTVDLSATLPPVAARTHTGPPGFGRAVVGSLHGLLNTVRVLGAGAGYLVPFVIVLVPVGLALVWLWKRLRPQTRSAPVSATPEA